MQPPSTPVPTAVHGSSLERAPSSDAPMTLRGDALAAALSRHQR